MYIGLLFVILFLGIASRASGEQPRTNPKSFPVFFTLMCFFILVLTIMLLVDGGNLTK